MVRWFRISISAGEHFVCGNIFTFFSMLVVLHFIELLE